MRRALLFVLVAGLGLLAGCVTFHSAIVIEPDGSGTCTLNFSVSESVKAALAESGSMGGEGKDMPSIDDFDRAEMEKRAKDNGVTITSFEHQTAEGRETVAIAMTFKDVTGLSRVMRMGGSSDDGVLAILRNAEGNYVLTSIPDPNPPAETAEEAAKTDEKPATPEDPAKAMELMGILMQSISELDIRMEVTVPGDVLSSSAPTVEGRTSVWAINAANMMEAQNMATEPEITFSKQGVNIDAPTRQE
jgi:hypothetical protein